MNRTAGLMLMSFCFGIGFTAIVISSIPSRRSGCTIPYSFVSSGHAEMIVATVSDDPLNNTYEDGMRAWRRCEDGTFLSILQQDLERKKK